MTKQILTVATILFAFVAQSQTISLGTAINKAGKQRMLVQRMAKDYMCIGAGVKVAEATADIDEVTSLFNENHRELTTFAKSKETKDALIIVNNLWANFRLKMASDPDIRNAESIISEANALTIACNQVVEKIQTLNATASGSLKLTNMCGRQRLNLQKIAMLYMAKSWGVEYIYLDRDLKEAISGFDSNLANLASTKENTPEINESLQFQKSEWEFLKKSFGSESMKPGNIFSSTNLMTKEFDAITAKYDKLVVDNGKIAGN